MPGQPILERTIAGIFADNRDLLLVNITLDQRKHVRMATSLFPNHHLLLNCVYAGLVNEQLNGKLVCFKCGLLFSEPDFTKHALAKEPRQGIGSNSLTYGEPMTIHNKPRPIRTRTDYKNNIEL